jgi:hypothetical protein
MQVTSRKRSVFIVLGIVIVLVAALAYTLVRTRANTTPTDVVTRFYGSWIEALRTGPATPIEQGLQTKSTYVTEGFGRSVERAARAGRDGVLCRSTAPTAFTVVGATESSDGQHAGVDFTADEVSGHVVLVRDTSGWWRIDEVDCPTNAQNQQPPSTSSGPVATPPAL